MYDRRSGDTGEEMKAELERKKLKIKTMGLP